MNKSKEANTSVIEDSVDRISNMPDPILHLILSGIPSTEEVIRTSILSRRWRYLWTSVPFININDYRALMNPHSEFKKNEFEEFVCRVFENISLDLESVCLSSSHPFNNSTVGQWIEAAVRRNVKLLDLSFAFEDQYDGFQLPHCLGTCESLEELRLKLYADCLSFPESTSFLPLRVLQLEGCRLVNSDLVHSFFKSLTSLEDLSLIGCAAYSFDTFSISCPKLKNLRIDSRVSHHLVIELCNRLEICCPKLVFLKIAGLMAMEIDLKSLGSLKKAVIYPDNEYESSGKVVGELLAGNGISHVESLSLRIGFIEEDIDFKNLPISLPNLKNLEVTTTIDATANMDLLIQILKCSPNLQSFHIIIEEGSLYLDEVPDVDFFEERKCRFEQLKMAQVTGITPAFPDDIDFIKFLLKSTPVLDTMSITPRANMTDGDLRILTLLSKFQRASPEAEIIFVQDQV